MADSTITGLPNAATLSGTEYIPIDQGGDTVKTTADALADLVSTALTLAPIATSGSASDLTTGTVPAARLPNPSASTLGGVKSIVGVSHQWINSISTAGLPSLSQPAFTDISGSVAATQMPAFTGDATTVAGAVALTFATVNANVGTFGSATQSLTLTTNAKGLLTAVAAQTITPAVGSITGLGTGVATWLATPTGANLTTALSSGGGTFNFLRADGTFATPAGSFTSPLTTKGDVHTYSTVDARLAVGSNGQVLTADSAQTLGVKWATPSASGGAGLSIVMALLFGG